MKRLASYLMPGVMTPSSRGTLHIRWSRSFWARGAGMRYALHSTPVGSLTAVADDDGVVHASGWTTEVDALVRIMRPPLRFGAPALRPDLGAVSRAIGAYLEGDVTAIDDIAVHQSSGDRYLAARQQADAIF